MSRADEAVHAMEDAGRMIFPWPKLKIRDDLAKEGLEMADAGVRGQASSPRPLARIIWRICPRSSGDHRRGVCEHRTRTGLPPKQIVLDLILQLPDLVNAWQTGILRR